ncbi:hypothetical protein F4560_006807 [Saccharothrix ecbatanensis]|uniref:Uncharacterized protein n=1 Tax=Saccharothrix ecbatanensis TaxID=1105145 RepID=A0A7W9HS99_9PSEU|nr:hypothetical protein [Saccharothrix ecbatanensis]MBB5807039.1 hypothetical protein [Saccharothrix ecbatanensis]
MSDLITTYPLPFVLLAALTVVVAVLLWRVVVSAALTACALWALAAHGGSDVVVVMALCALITAAFVVFQPARSPRRVMRLRRQEVTR